jgi:superfamily II DNA or RNA helicase
LGIAERSAHEFSPAVLARGSKYFDEGRVLRVQVSEDEFRCDVRGSGRERYAVVLNWRPEDLTLDAWCVCPHYSKGELCKHVWAVILEVDAAGWPADFAVTPNDTDVVSVLHDHDGGARQQWADVEPDTEWLPGPSSVAIPSVGRWPGLVADDRSAWREPLRAVLESHSIATARKRQTAPRRAWFAIDLNRSYEQEVLVVAFYHQPRLQSDEWGKVRAQAFTPDDVNLYPDPEDQALLKALYGTPSPAHGVPFGTDPFTKPRAALSPVLFPSILPRMFATGRVILHDRSADESQPLRWDDGSPWHLDVEIVTDEARKEWRVERVLTSDARRRSLDDASLLLEDGVVVFDDTVGLYENRKDFGPWLRMLTTGPLHIPFRDRIAFNQLWWSGAAPLSLPLPESLALPTEKIAPRASLNVVDSRRGDESRTYADVSVRYANIELPSNASGAGFVDVKSERVFIRDREGERALMEQVTKAGIRTNSGYFREPAPFSFPTTRFTHTINALINESWRIETGGVMLRQAGELSVELTSGVDWFDLHGTIDFDGASVDLPVLLEAIRTDQEFVVLDDGSKGLIGRNWVEENAPWAAMGGATEGGLRFRPSHALILDIMLDSKNTTRRYDAQSARWREQLASVESLEALAAPDTFKGTLREYQCEGLAWLEFLRTTGLGGCLADDMGLGKTVQVLAMLERVRTQPELERLPSLIVVPKSLVFNWLAEARNFTPNLVTLDYSGTNRGPLREQFDDVDMVVTTYGTMRQDIVHLAERRFRYVVLDEAQAIKNPRAQVAKACRLLDADHRLAVTGTPIENRLTDLWSIFEFLNPGLLGESKPFSALARRANTDAQAEQTLDALSRGLRPFIMRRTKEQAAPELPSKTEQTLVCELGPKQRKHYDELREYYRRSLAERVDAVGLNRSKVHVLEALLRLRQAACHQGLVNEEMANEPSAKLEVLVEHLTDLANKGQKVLVFSQFTKLLALVKTALEQHQLRYEYLDGRTRNREARVQNFRESDDIPIFLISLKAGGHGLNLTEASYVFILDPWWNPAVEAQAVDRTHRIGQTQPVFAYRLIAADTVEEKVVELQRHKRKLADAIITENRNVLSDLTEDDLALLLS